MTGADAGARGEPAVERRDDAAAFADAAVFGREHELDAEAPEEIEIEELRGAARAVEERARTPRARSASASAANGARPTPPATIHASVGGSTSVNGRPSGPRQEIVSPGCAS